MAKDPLAGVKCEVCNDEPAIGVYSVPGVPMSCAYGEKCIKAEAHPWNVLVANVSCIGDLSKAAPWVVEMVDATCKHLGKTREQFDTDVHDANKKMEEYFEQQSQERQPGTSD